MNVERGDLENVRLLKDIIKSSLGPNGLSKLLVHATTGKIIANSSNLYTNIFASRSTKRTNDKGALLRAQQYMISSFKDGSTSVVLLAASFIEVGHKLLMEGLSRHLISESFQKGVQSAIAIVDSMPKRTITINLSSPAKAQPVVEMMLSSKVSPRECKFLAQLLTTAVCTVLHSKLDTLNASTYSSLIDSIRLCPCVGGELSMSELLDGIVIPYAPITSKCSISSIARIAIFATSLSESHTKTKLQAKLNTPQVLMQWQKEEEQLLKDTAMKIVDSGAHIVISSGTIHKYILHWFDVHGIVAVQSVPKIELISISEATGAKLVYQTSFFDSLDLGTIQSCDTMNLSGDQYFVIKARGSVSVVVRGSTRHKVNQLLRNCGDLLAVIREMKMVEVGGELLGEATVICGGGAPEMHVLTQLKSVPDQTFMQEHVLTSFATGFEIIPKTLIENSGSSIDLYHALKERYELGSTSIGVSKHGSLEELSLQDEVFVDFLEVKKRIWSTAVDVASMVLVVDDSILGGTQGL